MVYSKITFVMILISIMGWIVINMHVGRMEYKISLQRGLIDFNNIALESPLTYELAKKNLEEIGVRVNKLSRKISLFKSLKGGLIGVVIVATIILFNGGQ